MKVPDEWIERALAVPSAQAREPHRFSQRSRRLAAAAAVVLVLGLSISLYFSFRNINEPTGVIEPSTPPTVTQPTEAPPRPTETDVHAPASDTPTAPPTEAKSDSPTAQAPTQPSPTEPNTSASEPAVPPAALTEPATQSDTQPTTQPATQPPEPHTDAPVPPTEKPTEEPVNTPEITPTSDRSAEICHPLGSGYVGTASEDDAIYCRLYDLAGNPIGSPNPFAAEHRAEIVWPSPDDGSTGIAYLYYAFSGTVEAHPSEPLRCIYVFYYRNGFEIARGSITL